MKNVPKAVLYYHPKSLWSASAILALEEKGYNENEVELRVVDVDKCENLAMTFLRINPKGFLPTLVVPLADSLSPDVENRYKAVTEVKAVLELLDKSRSAISRTHTVSQAPAPSLAPATIAQALASNSIITTLHSLDEDVNDLVYYNALDDDSLRLSSLTLLPILQGKAQAISDIITTNQNAQVSASERTRKLWNERKAELEKLLVIYANADKSDDELSTEQAQARKAFFDKARNIWQTKLPDALAAIDKEFVGPYTLGDQLSIADLHLGPWVAQVASLLGCTDATDGDEFITRLESRVGNQFSLPKDFQLMVVPDLHANPTQSVTLGEKRAKLAVFFEVVRKRPSWKKAYPLGA